MKDSKLIDLFQRSRSSLEKAVIEGVHALKHAVRFKAEFEVIATSDKKYLLELLDELAPDVKQHISEITQEVSDEVFLKLSPLTVRTKVVAIAKRLDYKVKDIDKNKPIVFLEQPRDLENIGAVIRVAAAADAAAVCISAPIDIFNPAILRGAAGLHFAIPVFNISDLDEIKGDREVVALDPTGNEDFSKIPKNSIFIFGTERFGISKKLLDKSDQIIRLPMKDGISSLNLATSVTATLYRL